MIKVWSWRDFQGREYNLRFSLSDEKVRNSKKKFGIREEERIRYVKERLKPTLQALKKEGVVVTIKDDLSFSFTYPWGADWEKIRDRLSSEIDSALKQFYKEHGFVLVGNRLEIDYKNLAKEFSKEMRIFSFYLNKALGFPKDSYKLLEGVLSFVQSLNYGVPTDRTPTRERGGLFTPWEVLFYGYGDCDSKSLLFASIWENLAPEIPYVFLEYPDEPHINLGVKNIWRKPGVYVVHNGEEYIICEASACCFPPGDVPFSGKVRIL